MHGGRHPAQAISAVGLLLLAIPGLARADFPARRDSPGFVLEQIERVESMAGHLAGPAGLSRAEAVAPACAGAAKALANCESSQTSLESCREGLLAVYEDAAARRATAAGPAAMAASRLATEAADGVHRIEIAKAAFARGACERLVVAGEVPAIVRLLSDGRTLVVRPGLALRGGRAYSLVLEGGKVQASLLDALRASVVPSSGGQVPRGAFSGPFEESFARDPGLMEVERTIALLNRLENGAQARAGHRGSGGVQLRWPTPVRADQLRGLRFYFAPAGQADAGRSITSFRTIDARKSLRDFRARLRGLDCSAGPSTLDLATTLGMPEPSIAGLFGGRHPSLSVETGDPEPVSYMLSVPADWHDTAGLVIGVHGHEGSAERVIRHNAAGLARRGLALLALDLPNHGERKNEAGEFLDPLRPFGLAMKLRQATVDVLAAVWNVRRCGLPLPGGRVYRPEEILYLGYSVGSMVGLMARAVEPDLGAMVLLAPGVGIERWLTNTLFLVPTLGRSDYVMCIGGPADGRSCFPSGVCPAPGACVADPYIAELTESLQLPYALAVAGLDPIELVRHRTGPATKAPLLMITGGLDIVLPPEVATRLADAAGLRPKSDNMRRGPHATLIQYPGLGHELGAPVEIREQAYDFLATRGRRGRTPLPASVADAIDDQGAVR